MVKKWITKFKLWLKNLRFYTKSQYEALEKNYETVMVQYKDIRARNDVATELNNTLPFNFDKLISIYTDRQLNAFVYKAISAARKDPSKRYLLERWLKRCEDAKTTLNEVHKQE